MAMRVWTSPITEWQAGRRDPPGLAGARAYLARYQESVCVLDCYQHFFPAEFAASTAARLPGDDAAWSAAEMEFFQLVNDHLFPVCLDYLEDSQSDGPDGRELTLPIHPGGFTWWEEFPTETRLGWRILCVLVGIWTIPAARLPPAVAALLEPVASRALIPPVAILRDLCTPPAPARTLVDLFAGGAGDADALPAPPPLAALPAALEMLEHDTDTAWLNVQLETPVDLTWNRADLDFIIDDYRRAQAILDQVDPFLAWLESGITPVRHLVALWKKARRHAGLAPRVRQLPTRRLRHAE